MQAQVPPTLVIASICAEQLLAEAHSDGKLTDTEHGGKLEEVDPSTAVTAATAATPGLDGEVLCTLREADVVLVLGISSASHEKAVAALAKALRMPSPAPDASVPAAVLSRFPAISTRQLHVAGRDGGKVVAGVEVIVGVMKADNSADLACVCWTLPSGRAAKDAMSPCLRPALTDYRAAIVAAFGLKSQAQQWTTHASGVAVTTSGYGWGVLSSAERSALMLQLRPPLVLPALREIPGNSSSITLHMVRHGQGTHNLAAGTIGRHAYRSWQYHDASLDETGIAQCQAVRRKFLEAGATIDAVIVSPLTRTLHTASLIFPPEEIPTHALEVVREAYGGHPCDRRRSRRELEADFPLVDFSTIAHGEDPLWTATRETVMQVSTRAREFVAVLRAMRWGGYKSVALVSHGVFLDCLMVHAGLPLPEGFNTAHFGNCEVRALTVAVGGGDTK